MGTEKKFIAARDEFVTAWDSFLDIQQLVY
jgi:hypothetical protein